MSGEASEAPPGDTDPDPTEEPVTNDPIERAAKPWWRWTSTWIVGAAVVVIGAAAVWLVAGSSQSTTTDTVAAPNFAEVQRTTLEDVTTLDGTLGFVAGDPLVYAGSPDGIVTIAAGAPGTVTSLASEGATVDGANTDPPQDAAYEVKEVEARLASALEDETDQIVWEYVLDGAKPREIAEDLGMPVTDLYGVIRRIRRRFKKIYCQTERE